ncbi:MAG: hypothetical protein DMD64_13010, partial [Gemmatimonadetes bacterium]
MISRLQWFTMRCALVACLAAPRAAAQQPSSALATRAALQSELARLEAGGNRDHAAAALVRWRL